MQPRAGTRSLAALRWTTTWTRRKGEATGARTAALAVHLGNTLSQQQSRRLLLQTLRRSIAAFPNGQQCTHTLNLLSVVFAHTRRGVVHPLRRVGADTDVVQKTNRSRRPCENGEAASAAKGHSKLARCRAFKFSLSQRSNHRMQT